MQEPVLTLSLKCATSHVCRHISCEHRQAMICDALYGSCATHWRVLQLAPQFCTCPVLFCRLNFVQFCTNFQLAAFQHKTIFLRTRLHISARAAHRRLNASQWASESLCTGKNVHILMCNLFICTVDMFRALQFQCEQSCANDRAPLHNLTINVHNVYNICICVLHMLMALGLLCAPLPWWTIC